MSSSRNDDVKRTKVTDSKGWGREPTDEELQAVKAFSVHLGINDIEARDAEIIHELKNKLHSCEVKAETNRDVRAASSAALCEHIGSRLDKGDGNLKTSEAVRVAHDKYTERVKQRIKGIQFVTDEECLVFPVNPKNLPDAVVGLYGDVRSFRKSKGLSESGFELPINGMFKDLLPKFLACFGDKRGHEIALLFHGFGMFCNKDYYKALKVHVFMWRTPVFALPMLTSGSFGGVGPREISDLYLSSATQLVTVKNDKERVAAMRKHYLSAGLPGEENILPATRRSWNNMIYFTTVLRMIDKHIRRRNVLIIKHGVVMFRGVSENICRHAPTNILSSAGLCAALIDVLYRDPGIVLHDTTFGEWYCPSFVNRPLDRVEGDHDTAYYPRMNLRSVVNKTGEYFS